MTAKKLRKGREGWIIHPSLNFLQKMVDLGDLGNLTLTFKWRNGKIKQCLITSRS